MTTAKTELTPIYDLIGQTLSDLGAHYEILTIRFGEFEVQVSCFARIVHNGEILLTTQDYQSWDEQDYKHNDMYLNIAKHGAVLIGRTVRAVEVSAVNDLFITLDNDAKIEIFNSEGDHRLTEESEQWVFFKPHNDSYPFVTVYGKTIDIADMR